MFVGKPQKRGDHCKPHRERHHFAAGEQRHRIADQADERKGPYPAKGVSRRAFALDVMFFSFEANQKRKEKDQEDFDPFER